MMSVQGEESQIVTVLHDVIEDTSVTVDDLRAAGFNENILAAVLLVTHRKVEPYAEYVVRCRANEVARRVKLADLGDNTRLDRTILRPQRFEADVARLRKYVLSYKYLTDQITEEQYRTLMGGEGGRVMPVTTDARRPPICAAGQPVLSDDSSWHFQEGRNRAVFTTKPVLKDGHPILLVTHDGDGDWQFLCGTTNRPEDWQLVSLACIFERDRIIAEVADLAEGWTAFRPAKGGTWRRGKVEEG